MLFALITLTLAFVASVVLNVLVLRAGARAGRQLTAYEEFYGKSLEDVDSIITMLDELMSERVIFSADDDVQNLYRVITILHDTLVGYRRAAKENDIDDKE